MGRRGGRVNWQNSACNSVNNTCGCGSNFDMDFNSIPQQNSNGMRRIPFSSNRGQKRSYRVVYKNGGPNKF